MLKITNCKAITASGGTIRTSASYICDGEELSNSSPKALHLVKHNSFSWSINDFVTNHIAQAVLGKEYIHDAYIMPERLDKQPRDFTATIIKKLNDKFTELAGNTDIEFTKLAGRYELDTEKHTSKLNKKLDDTLLNGKPVNGFYEAQIFAALTDDGDVTGNNNFALIEGDSSYRVIKYDYDDSLKFFDNFGITSIRLTFPKKTLKLLKDNGMTPEDIEARQAEMDKDVTYHSADGYFTHYFKQPKGKQLKTKLKDSLENVLAKKDDIFEAITKAYEVVDEKFSNEQLAQTYNFYKAPLSQSLSSLEKARNYDLNKICKVKEDPSIFTFVTDFFGNSESKTPVIEQIKDYTDCIITRRLKDLEQFKNCLEIELSSDRRSTLSKLGYNKVNEAHPAKPFMNYDNEHLICKFGENFAFVTESSLDLIGES